MLDISKKTVYWGQRTLWDFQIPAAISSSSETIPPPFNGVTVFLNLAKSTTGDESLHERVWDSTRTFSDHDVQTSASLVKRLSELGYTDNFVALPVSNGFADNRHWWDGSTSSENAFAVVKEHVFQGAFIAGAGGCRGVLCNLEGLGAEPFSSHIGLTRFPDYQAFRNFVKRHGFEFIQSLEQGFAEGVRTGGGDQGNHLLIVLDRAILSVYLDMAPFNEDDTSVEFCKWANNSELVWLCFLNGMIEGASPNTIFIDNCEGESYGVYGRTGPRSYPAFSAIRRKWLDTDSYSDGLFSGPIRQKYEQQYKLGFIFWFLGGPSEQSKEKVGHDPIGTIPVNPNRPIPKGDGNSEKLEMLGSDALASSDEYLFIYTQEDFGLFHSIGDPPTNIVPPEYVNVLANLKSLSGTKQT